MNRAWCGAMRMLGPIGYSVALVATALGQSPPPQQGEELLVQMRLEQGPESLVTVLRRDSQVLVPLTAVVRLAGYPFEMGTGHRIAGRLTPSQDRFWVDIAEGDTASFARIGRGDSVLVVSAASWAWWEGELLLDLPTLEYLFRIRLGFDLAQLAINAGSVEHLPAIRRGVRERRRRSGSGLARLSPTLDHHVSAPPLLFGAGVIDYSLTVASRDPTGTWAGRTDLGVQLAGGSTIARLEHDRTAGEGRSELRWSWNRSWEAERPFRTMEMGDIASGGLSPVPIRGFRVSTTPELRPNTFGRERLSGVFGPGWEVEVRADGALVASTMTDATGRYEIELPVRYGQNVVQIVAYGPDGDEVTEHRYLLVPFELLPQGRTEFGVTIGDCTGVGCQAMAGFDLRRGLSGGLTVRQGVELLWQDSAEIRARPYVRGVLRLAPPLTLSTDLQRDLGTTSRLAYLPSGQFQTSASHTRSERTAGGQSLGATTTRTQGTVFWRPTASTRTQFQFSASRGASELGKTQSRQLVATRRLNSARAQVSVQQNSREDAYGNRSNTATATLSADGVLRFGGALLRRTSARAGVTLNDGGGVARYQAGVGRTLLPGLRLDIDLTWDRMSGSVLRLDLATAQPTYRAVSRNRVDSEGPFEGTQQIYGSVQIDPTSGRIGLGSGHLVGRGAVGGVVWVDEDGDGWHDPQEPPIASLTLIVSGRAVRTDATGRFVVWDLAPFQPIAIATDTTSLDDPSLRPVQSRYQMVTQPNTTLHLAIPFYRTGEVSGRVLLAGKGVAGVEVVISDGAGTEHRRVTTFRDGEFYVTGLPPGEYKFSVAASDLSALRAIGRFESVRVLGGGIVDDIVIELAPRTP